MEGERVRPRRVLMVSYNYPPTGASGSIRTTKLAKYLPSCGWLPTVLTVGREKTRWSGSDESDGVLPGVTVVRAPFPDVLTAAKEFLVSRGLLKAGGPGSETVPRRSGDPGRGPTGPLVRLFRWLKRWATFPDRYNLWLPFALARGLKELSTGEYDAIYSSSPPVADNILAFALQRLSGLPWLADFRDPWTQNRYLEFTAFELRLTRALEKKVLSTASAIVTVSNPLADMLSDLHGRGKGGVRALSNAFDPEEFGGLVEPLKDRFVVTYAGMLYGGKRSPAGFLEAVEGLIDRGSISPGEILVRFFGPFDRVLDEVVGSLRHRGILEVNETVGRREIIERERESTVLLILSWDDPYSALSYGGKVFEYLGAGRPILAWNPNGGLLAELLEKTGAGESVASREQAMEVLERWITEWRDTGEVAHRPDESEVSGYGWDLRARDFAAILDDITTAG